MTSNFKQVAILTIAMTLAGCSLAPTYERPTAPVSEQWSDVTDLQTHQPMPHWQGFVLDPVLRDLISTSLTNNRSLRQSLLDIEQARALYRIESADRIPSIYGSATGTRQRGTLLLPGGEASVLSSNYQVGLSLPEYELDLFGRVRHLSEVALEQYLATEEAARSTKLALIADVAQTYLGHYAAEKRLALTRQALKNRKDSLELIKQRLVAGEATALEYQEAVGLVEQARAELERNERDKRQFVNALTLVVGTSDVPKLISLTTMTDPMLLQELSPGVPSDLIERRPDILASEHRLKARNANIGAARAAFFPRISLTGFLGSSSTELSGLFESGTRAWSFIPSLSLPIFAGGRNRANLDLAMLRKESAVAEYEGTIQMAFKEVADALAAADTLRREEASRRALADASQASLVLARARYEEGVDSHLRYLDAQRSVFENELGYINVVIQRQIALVDLFRSLGGGWGPSTLPIASEQHEPDQ